LQKFITVPPPKLSHPFKGKKRKAFVRLFLERNAH
jgi:hypothetical protein